MAGGAKVVIGADVREVRPALDSVARAVLQTEGQVNGAFQGWVGNSNAVATATEKLERQLKSFAQEQRQQGRMAKFYANELLEMVPAAEGVKKSLQGLMGLGIEGLAGGMGFGLALEGAKLLVSVVSSVGEEARKSLEKADSAVTKILDEWTKKAEGLKRALIVLQGGEGAGIRFDLKNALRSVDAEIAEVQKKIEGQLLPNLFNSQWEKLEELKKKRSELVAKAAEAYATEKLVSGEKERQAEVTKSANDAERERLRIVQEVAKAEQAIRDFRAKAWEKGEFPDMGFDQKTLEEMTFFKEKKIGDEAQQKLNERFAEGWQKGELPDMGDQLERVAQKGASLADIGSTIGEAFSSAGAAIGGIGGAITSQIGAVVQMTLKFIGLAIAAAEASAAATPVVGWVAAAGAGAAVLASIISLTAGIGARADGGPVSAFRPYLVGERGPELIVPGASGTVIPNEALGGGSVNVTFNAPVDQAWWRANERYIVRTLRDAARAGRA